MKHTETQAKKFEDAVSFYNKTLFKKNPLKATYEDAQALEANRKRVVVSKEDPYKRSLRVI